jgi:hypothetical protein
MPVENTKVQIPNPNDLFDQDCTVNSRVEGKIELSQLPA